MIKSAIADNDTKKAAILMSLLQDTKTALANWQALLPGYQQMLESYSRSGILFGDRVLRGVLPAAEEGWSEVVYFLERRGNDGTVGPNFTPKANELWIGSASALPKVQTAFPKLKWECVAPAHALQELIAETERAIASLSGTIAKLEA